MIYTKVRALKSLKPNKQFTWSGEEYSGLTWLESDTAPTESEIDTELTRLTNAEPMRLLRVERNRRIAETDWMANSDVTMTDDWKTYRQALRDLPSSASPALDEQGNLTNVTWPTKPTERKK